MPNRTSNVYLLRQRVIESSKRQSAPVNDAESGSLDRAALNRQIDEILDGVPEKSELVQRIEQTLDVFFHALQQGDVPATAQHVCALLSLELDDLRKAALLSLMVRLVGKRKFDPIAAYILQNQKVYVSSPG